MFQHEEEMSDTVFNQCVLYIHLRVYTRGYQKDKLDAELEFVCNFCCDCLLTLSLVCHRECGGNACGHSAVLKRVLRHDGIPKFSQHPL